MARWNVHGGTMTGPSWWIHPGKDIEFDSHYHGTQTLILTSDWGEVDIKAGPGGDTWTVSFKCAASERVPDHALDDTVIWYGGKVYFTTDQLRHAFNLGGTKKRALLTPSEMAARKRFDAAVQGLFVRKDDFLAIPVAGNGKLPFPTVAVRVTKDIQDHVLAMIENRS